MKAAALLVCVLALTQQPVEASAQTCTLPDSVASTLPDTIPSPGPYATIRDQGVPFSEVDLGVGHLRPTDATWKWDWLTEITLPLSETRAVPPWGWIAGGWIVEVGTGRIAPFTVSGLVETGYEEATFIVLESSGDGWIEIRFAPDSSGRSVGTAWVPECALSGANVHLQLERWQERLLSDQISPLFFRSDVPHVLRDAPGSGGAELGLITGNYHLEPLEIVGDWMRVDVSQPSDYCAPDVEPVVRRGWVKWRSADKGPWVWYFTRGC